MKYSFSESEKNYQNWYDPECPFSLEDQKAIFEGVPFTEPDDEEEETKEDKTNVNVLNGSVNGSYKRSGNANQTLAKLESIAKLKACNYRTSPKEVTSYLEIIFEKYNSQEGHWLYIAQTYTPKTINSVINLLLKQHARGEKKIQNAAKYFTYSIKFRSKRKTFRSTNGSHKQQPGGQI